MSVASDSEDSVGCRRVFAALTTALTVLAIATGGIWAVQALLTELGDTPGARVARAIGLVCLVALEFISLLLLGALGLRAARADDSGRL